MGDWGFRRPARIYRHRLQPLKGEHVRFSAPHPPRRSGGTVLGRHRPLVGVCPVAVGLEYYTKRSRDVLLRTLNR
jgi:hypothetical protein